jgi:hypothetical protein
MVGVTTLWLPILLSAVVVFIASSIIHMVLGYHRSDYGKLPNEDKVLEGLREQGVSPGNYAFPHMSGMKEMGTPEGLEKCKKGPVGVINIIPNGPPPMGKYLTMWFLYSVVVSFFVAYVAGSTLARDAEYLSVFRLVGTVAFLSYSAAQASDSIWKGQAWSTTVKHIVDGLIYGLLTAGVFGWLWPR